MVVVARRNRAGLDQSGEKPRRVFRLKAEIEVYRDAGIEIDLVERRADRGAARGKGIAVIADGAFEDERDAVRAVVEVVEDLRVGGLGVGVVDPLHHAPRQARRAGRDRTRLVAAAVERLDGDAVIGLGLERGEGRAFERFFHQRPPCRLAGGCEALCQGKFSHVPQALSGPRLLLA